jgi:hypothetical protein
VQKLLSRVYKHAFEIWERAHQDLKELIKKYPAVKNNFFEKQLDIAGTNAQINLMKYELTVVPKRAAHKSSNHTGRGRSVSTKNPAERPSPTHILREVFHK